MRRSRSLLQGTATIIPIPMNLGQPNMGLDKAPSVLIGEGLPSLLGNIGWRVKLASAIVASESRTEDFNGIRNCEAVGNATKMINERVSKELSAGTFPLILGGDHGISLGTIPAIKARNKNTGIMWVDAHTDCNTPQGSVSGNMHGMPLAFLLGQVPETSTLPGLNWLTPLTPVVDPQDIVYIGVRDVDPFERRLIKRLGIKAFSMYDVDKLGIGGVMERALDHLQGKDIHLSFDIDAIDPFYAPHTGTAVRGGLTYREGNFICEELANSGRLTSMEMVEVDPEQHRDKVDPMQTVSVALQLIASAMGQRILD